MEIAGVSSMKRFHHRYGVVDEPTSRSSINIDATVESQEGVGVGCSPSPAGRGSSVRLVQWALCTGGLGLMFTLLLAASSAVQLFSRSSTSLRTDQSAAFETEGLIRVSRKVVLPQLAVVMDTPVAIEESLRFRVLYQINTPG